MIEVTWSILKSFVDDRNVPLQYVDLNGNYWIVAIDGAFSVSTLISQENPENENLIDFEENYKADGNQKLDAPKDSDGSPLQRTKITTTGWHYQLHGLEFETSKLNSIYSKKVDNTDYGFTTIKYYKLVSGVETLMTLTGTDEEKQTDLDTNCIKTIIEWEPNHDLEIIGGMLKQKESPSEDLRLWVVGVPDVPENYGGSKPFAVNVNLAFMGIEEGVKVDGRAPKYLTYSNTYHTTKLQIILRHSAGFKHKLNMVFELFKA